MISAFAIIVMLVSRTTSFQQVDGLQQHPQKTKMNRKNFIQSVSFLGACLLDPASAFSATSTPGTAKADLVNEDGNTGSPGRGTQQASVAYRSLSLDMGESYGGAKIPVACWYPTGNRMDAGSDDYLPSSALEQKSVLRYPHRISVKRIGQLLAGWDWIPEIASRDFLLKPTLLNCVDGQNVPLPTRAPVVFLAHGYLGSRFDLSHLAEALAAEGFICFSPEYAESLAASYNRVDGLDRTPITQKLVSAVKDSWGVEPTSYGIVGHSLGCGTAIRTGDESWTRVCIAGFPGAAPVPGSALFVSSMNDGALSLARFGGKLSIPEDFVQLKEEELVVPTSLPSRAALVFDRPDAPNHISFLAEGTNDAMIDLLSPLLPVAQALAIPVLDFDRYQISRDSRVTAEIVRPLVARYLKQHMRMT